MRAKRDEFTPEETKSRFEAALRGARIAGAQHKEKRPKRQRQSVVSNRIPGKPKPR